MAHDHEHDHEDGGSGFRHGRGVRALESLLVEKDTSTRRRSTC
jgi:hypothetical protein